MKIALWRGRVPAGSGSYCRAMHRAEEVSGCSARDLCTWALATKVQLLEQKHLSKLSCSWVDAQAFLFLRRFVVG